MEWEEWICRGYLRKGAFVVYLLAAAWQDVSRRRIRGWVYWAGAILAALSRAAEMTSGGLGELAEAQQPAELALGPLVGLGLLALCRLTGGAVGAGDGWFFAVSGLYLGLWDNLLLLLSGLWLCFLFAGGMLLWGKCTGRDLRKRTIPFLPFLVPAAWMILVQRAG